MAEFKKAAKKSEVQAGSARTVSVDGVDVALFNVDGTVYATANTCPHRGGPLGEGEIDGCTVTCPLHGWQYDVTSGECQTTPGQHVQVYKVVVEGGEVKLEL